jgi:hypothetical protein
MALDGIAIGRLARDAEQMRRSTTGSRRPRSRPMTGLKNSGRSSASALSLAQGVRA